MAGGVVRRYEHDFRFRPTCGVPGSERLFRSLFLDFWIQKPQIMGKGPLGDIQNNLPHTGPF